MMTATNPSEVRAHLIEALQLDLVSPTPDNVDINHYFQAFTQASSKVSVSLNLRVLHCVFNKFCMKIQYIYILFN
jgi:hypothetical protein